MRKLIVVLISDVGTDKTFVIACSIGNYQIDFIVCSIGNYEIVALISFLLHAERLNTSIWYVDTNVKSRKFSFICSNDIKFSYTVFNYSFN